MSPAATAALVGTGLMLLTWNYFLYPGRGTAGDRSSPVGCHRTGDHRRPGDDGRDSPGEDRGLDGSDLTGTG